MSDQRGSTPAVSVVIANFNGRHWLADAVRSVLDQTLTDLELIVVDDGSTDGSPELLDTFAERDRRMRVVRLPRSGVVIARNRGLAEACAPLIAVLDADDVAAPDRLRKQADYLANRPEVGVVATWADAIDDHGRRLHGGRRPTSGPEVFLRRLDGSNPIVHSSVMARTELVRRLGGYRAAFTTAEDYDLWLRVTEVAEIAILPEALVACRSHAGSLSRRSNLRQTFSIRLACRSARDRRQGRPDRLGELTTAPGWKAPPPANAPYARDAALFRWLDRSDLATTDPAWEAAAGEALLAEAAGLSGAELAFATLALIARWRASDPARRAAARAMFRRLCMAHPATVVRAVLRLPKSLRTGRQSEDGGLADVFEAAAPNRDVGANT